MYEEQGCAACHTISGAGGSAGPDLTSVGRTRDAAWLQTFIANPSSLHPGTEMPAYALPPAELEALVAFLQSLR